MKDESGQQKLPQALAERRPQRAQTPAAPSASVHIKAEMSDSRMAAVIAAMIADKLDGARAFHWLATSLACVDVILYVSRGPS